MEVVHIGRPSILLDNIVVYLKQLEAFIEQIDYQSSMQIIHKLNGLSVRIAPSEIKYINNLLTNLNKFHNSLKIRVEYSKSMKRSSTISYSILLDE